jgi:hypothetical protein
MENLSSRPGDFGRYPKTMACVNKTKENASFTVDGEANWFW